MAGMENDSVKRAGERQQAIQRVELRIYGRVQGVYYRAHALEEARKLGLTGWIRNEPDGSVRCQVQGSRDRIEAFIAWAWEGSPQAHVRHVDVKEIPVEEGEESFRITG